MTHANDAVGRDDPFGLSRFISAQGQGLRSCSYGVKKRPEKNALDVVYISSA